MKVKVVSAFALCFLFFGVLVTSVNFLHIKAESSTIYIRADGSIDPPTTNIISLDNVTYTFTANNSNSIVIERDGIILNGSGYSLKGSSSDNGITLIGIRDVTITSTQISGFFVGIYLSASSNNHIHGNTIANTVWSRGAGGIRLENSSYNNSISQNEISKNWGGIWLGGFSNNNSLLENEITGNEDYGIYLWDSSNNSISKNNVELTNDSGIFLVSSSNNNTIFGNLLKENVIGIEVRNSSYNIIFHNSFMNNTLHQVYDISWDIPVFFPSINTWDLGNLSGGNYWSDYHERYPNAAEINGSGIWDTSYVIDENNQDNYPLIPEFSSILMLPLFILFASLARLIYRRLHTHVQVKL